MGGEKEYVYTISNIKGHENGTTDLEHIYGKSNRTLDVRRKLNQPKKEAVSAEDRAQGNPFKPGRGGESREPRAESRDGPRGRVRVPGLVLAVWPRD